MPDMLVRLYDLPDNRTALDQLAAQGVAIRPAQAFEREQVLSWIREYFGARWSSEAAVCFARQPVSCHIAIHEQSLIGFACHEATRRNFFGPTAVIESHRGRGVGAALLLASLRAMHELGYAYAIIGGAGPTGFYRRHAGATVIEGSTPGIYRGALPPP